MTEADASQLIQRYSRSYFHADSAQGWFDANEHGNRIRDRAVAGSKVPIARGRELASALIENVAAAREALSATADRMREARQDGLLDREAMAGLSKKTKEEWITAVGVVKGDYSRSVAELKHWQEYAEQANQLPTLPDGIGGGELVRRLAETKAIREPGEDDADDFAQEVVG